MKDIYVYIAGPMNGRRGYNASEFFEAEIQLREKGYEPINPLRLSIHIADKKTPSRDLPLHGPLSDNLRDDFMEMDEWMIRNKADIILLLSGWEDSEGARQEREWAVEEKILVCSTSIDKLQDRTTSEDLVKENGVIE